MIVDVLTLPKTARYSTSEVADILGVTRRTVANYRVSGKLKPRVNKYNGRYYYTGEELHRFWRTM
jgi:DNA-binding transcriptional MerR regulator